MKKLYPFLFDKLLILPLMLLLFSAQTHAQVSKNLFERRSDSSIGFKDRASRKQSTSAKKVVHNSIIRCSAMEADATLRSQNPSLPSREKIEAELQKQIKSYKKKMSQSRTAATVYVIPVIVHVVHNGQASGVGSNITAEQVKSQIDVLNEDYRRKTGTPGYNTNTVGADVEIEFALALRDPQGKTLAEPGVHRVNGGRATWDSMDDIQNVLKPATQWDPTKYLNMWTVEYGGEMSNNLGFAQFPVLSGLDGMDDKNAGPAITDGLVMRYSAFGRVGNVQAPYDQGRTTSHEIGHWLGLRHIWGDMENCEGSDYCSDTPAASQPNYGCPTGTNSCTGEGNDMIENYMDYTDDGCMNIFTIEQKNRMRTVMLNSPRRKELLSSTVHVPTTGNKPFASFTANKTEQCVGTAINFSDQSSNSPNSWTWYIVDDQGQTVGNSNLQNPSLTFNTEGIYSVALVVSNAGGEDSVYYSNYLTILSNTNTLLPFDENFEGNTVLPNWIVYNPDGDRTWNLSDAVSANNSGSYSMYFDNYSEETDPTGKVDAVLSSKIDLSVNTYSEISFDVAYAMYSEDYSDTLVLYYSTDCGQNFTPFWYKAGTDLATAQNTIDEYIPSANEWRKEKISLAFLNGQSNVHLAIGNISGWGNSVYLDNIKIDVVTSVQAPVSAFSTATTSACQGTEVKFNDESTNVPKSWNWSFPGGEPSSSTEQNPSVVYPSAGTYTVSLTTANEHGSNTKTQDAYISIIANPEIIIEADKPSICQGDSVVLTAQGGQNYVWSDNRGLIGEGNSIKVKPLINTTYFLKGENTSGCLGDTSMIIQVNVTPEKPEITIADTTSAFTYVLVSSATSGNQWYLNGQPINGATEQQYTAIGGGSYEVSSTINGCSAFSEAVILTADEGTIGLNKELKIYPNPADNNISVRYAFSSKSKEGKVIIFNAIGLPLNEQKLSLNGNFMETTFDINHYPRGTYFIVLIDKGVRVSKTFIKN